MMLYYRIDVAIVILIIVRLRSKGIGLKRSDRHLISGRWALPSTPRDTRTRISKSPALPRLPVPSTNLEVIPPTMPRRFENRPVLEGGEEAVVQQYKRHTCSNMCQSGVSILLPSRIGGTGYPNQACLRFQNQSTSH